MPRRVGDPRDRPAPPPVGRGKTPGVGYAPPALSCAGTQLTRFAAPVPLDTTWSVHPPRRPDGTPCVVQEALAGRYAAGNRERWAAGAPGVHAPDLVLREMFANGFLGALDTFDGNPTDVELEDFYWCQAGDLRVKAYLAKVGTVAPPQEWEPLLKEARANLDKLEALFRARE